MVPVELGPDIRRLGHSRRAGELEALPKVDARRRPLTGCGPFAASFATN